MTAHYSIQDVSQLTGLSIRFIRRLKEGAEGLFRKHTERGAFNKLVFTEEIIEVLKGVREMQNNGRTLEQIVYEISGLGLRKNGNLPWQTDVKLLANSGQTPVKPGKLSEILEQTGFSQYGHKSNLSPSVRAKSSLTGLGQTPVKLLANRGQTGSSETKISSRRRGRRSLANYGQTAEGPTRGDSKLLEELTMRLSDELMFLQNEVVFLRELLKKTEDRFDRMLPEGKLPSTAPTAPVKPKSWQGYLLEAIITLAVATTAGAALLYASRFILLP